MLISPRKGLGGATIIRAWVHDIYWGLSSAPMCDINRNRSIPWLSTEFKGNSVTVEASMPFGVIADDTLLLRCTRERTLSQLGKVCRATIWSRSNITALNLEVRKSWTCEW